MKRHALTKPLLPCNAQFEIEKRLLYYLHKNAAQNVDANALDGYIEKVAAFLSQKSAPLSRSDVFNLINIRPVTHDQLSACLPSHIFVLSAEARDSICALTRETFGDASAGRIHYLQCIARNLRSAQAAQKAGAASAGLPRDTANPMDDADDARFVYDSAQEEDAGDQFEDGEDHE